MRTKRWGFLPLDASLTNISFSFFGESELYNATFYLAPGLDVATAKMLSEFFFKQLVAHFVGEYATIDLREREERVCVNDGLLKKENVQLPKCHSDRVTKTIHFFFIPGKPLSQT